MDRAVDSPLDQPLVEFARPQRLAADFGERAVLDAVAAGDHRDQFDRRFVPAMRGAQARARLVRLCHGKRRTAGSETDERLGWHRVGLP